MFNGVVNPINKQWLNGLTKHWSVFFVCVNLRLVMSRTKFERTKSSTSIVPIEICKTYNHLHVKKPKYLGSSLLKRGKLPLRRRPGSAARSTSAVPKPDHQLCTPQFLNYLIAHMTLLGLHINYNLYISWFFFHHYSLNFMCSVKAVVQIR